QIFISTNAGAYWDTLVPSASPGSYFTDLKVKDSLIVLLTNVGQIWISDNMGDSWLIKSTAPIGYYDNLQLVDGQIFCTAWKNGVIRSTDNGETWETYKEGLDDLGVYSILISGNLWLVGTERGVYRWNAAGAFWEEKSEGLSFQAPYRLFANDEYLLGFIDAEALAKISTSSDEWSLCQIDSGYFEEFIQSGDALLAREVYTGKIHRSLDGGNTWNVLPTSIIAYGLTALSDGTLFLMTSSEIFQSSDAGDTWFPCANLGNPSWYYFLSGGQRLFLILENGHIYRSDDKANTWEYVSNFPSSIYWLKVLDKEHIFATTPAGSLISFNGGLNWSLLSESFYDLLFFSDSILVAGLQPPSRVILSTNDGANWISIATGLPENAYVNTLAVNNDYLYAAIFINPDSLQENGVWRISLSSLGLSAVQAEMALEILMPFPNPSSNTVFIDIPANATKSKLRLTDISGKVCRELQAAAGTCLQIERENLKSGVYFLQLISEERGLMSVGKVVLTD
ncbi:MAG: T9SS type A sorting domain-containing protein, partial [Bacteroidota bacterium]